MSLEEFKTIYWWEWAHRFLGRLIGAAFFVPFVVFWLAGYIPRTCCRSWSACSCSAGYRARSAGTW